MAEGLQTEETIAVPPQLNGVTATAVAEAGVLLETNTTSFESVVAEAIEGAFIDMRHFRS